MKTGKRLLHENIGPGGTIKNDRFMRAIMQFRNTPMQDCRRSPSQMVFDRKLKDFLPTLFHKFEPAKDWIATQEYGERSLAKKRESDGIRWSSKSRQLKDIEIGTSVAIQNQTDSHPTKWDKTGVVLVNKPNSQLLIKVDGSKRTTLRNRRYVRPLHTEVRHPPQRYPDGVSSSNDVIQDDQGVETDDREVESLYEVNHDDGMNTIPTQQLDGGTGGDHVYAGVAGDAVVLSVQRDGGGALPPVSDAEPVSTRPRRSMKPNKKYDQEVFDLSYIECRQEKEVCEKSFVMASKDALAMEGEEA